MSEGWSERVSAFTQSFGSDELDASSLMLPLVGLLPADDDLMAVAGNKPKRVHKGPVSGGLGVLRR